MVQSGDYVNLLIAVATSTGSTRPRPEDIRSLFKASELSRQEGPLSLDDFKKLAKSVADATLDDVVNDAKGTPEQIKRFYGEVYEQLTQANATQVANQRSSYVSDALHVVNSLQKLAAQTLGAEAFQGLNFANYLAVPIANHFLKVRDYGNSINLLKHYGHSRLLTGGIGSVVMGRQSGLFAGVDLAIEDTLPEFSSVSGDSFAVTRITQHTEEGSKYPTHWLVHSKVSGQPFWNVSIKGFDKASAEYQQGVIKTKSLNYALLLAWAGNQKDKEAYTNALGLIVRTFGLDTRSSPPQPL